MRPFIGHASTSTPTAYPHSCIREPVAVLVRSLMGEDPKAAAEPRRERLPEGPDASPVLQDSVALTGSVFAFYCGDAALYDDTDGTWQPIHGGMLDVTVDSHGSPTKLWRFAELTPADDVVFIEAEGITVSNNGTACYGCSGSPTSFWVYRP
jgi:hypothetical protein